MDHSFKNKGSDNNVANGESSRDVSSSNSAHDLYGFKTDLTQLQTKADNSNQVFQLQSYQGFADNSNAVLQTKSLFGKIKAAGNSAIKKTSEIGGAAKAAVNQVNPYSEEGKSNFKNAYSKAQEVKSNVYNKSEEIKSAAVNKAKGYGEKALNYASAAKDLPNIKNTVDNLSVRVNSLENNS